ncbi:hypothetical protein I4U23_006358 [Adineta vaga]|nr:hypothetical protein I4U23_006358 [Adineta vaga]
MTDINILMYAQRQHSHNSGQTSSHSRPPPSQPVATIRLSPNEIRRAIEGISMGSQPRVQNFSHISTPTPDTTTGPSRPTTTDTYACPVFPKRFMERRSSEVICELELWKKVTMIGQASRWAWRGVCMTVKPY